MRPERPVETAGMDTQGREPARAAAAATTWLRRVTVDGVALGEALHL
jgi:hypothetical protein